MRDSGLLESALASAFQTFDGKELFPSKQEKAAKIGYALVSHHTVVDGNKRIGIYVMLPFRKSTAYILIRPLMRSSK